MAAEDKQVLRTTGSAPSCTLRTSIGSGGVESDLKPAAGDMAFLESEMRLTGPESYREEGTISFGENDNVLRFTSAEGHLLRSPNPETMAGSSTWTVEGGRGQFAAARGFIVSTFTLSGAGELSDFQCGLIFLPE